ncbi:hypothetical protein [Bradyrhizobium sp. SZCCHNR1045]|uniref:hypothetical protein n=1 Tax=Bradyrhizobium sp. SZCCHNR1045 TaxID=3057353 RepID=UPI002916C822|nr:hypothetical protein [Bradyrhizobium sp. SZCCHNR1045]
MQIITNTVAQPYPAQGQPGTKPTPLQTGASSTLKSDLAKLQPEIKAKVSDVVRRKP